MLDFFETLQIATLMAIRDYYKEKDKQKQRVADFNQQCIEGVANASSRLCDIIVDTSTKAFGDSTPKSVADGIYNLPFYAMLNVSRKQGGISLNQQKVLDIFFRNLNTSYNKIDFINAVNNRGNLENILYESVGLNGSKVGEFWSQFFSALRVTQCAQNILSEIIDCYSEIVMNFAFLNTNGESVTNSIVKEFINNVSNQYEVSFSNKDNIDFAGEKSFLQHKADLETLSWKIIQKSGDQGELDMKELLDNLFMSVLIGLSDLSNEPINKKAEILDYLLNISGVDTFETAIPFISKYMIIFN
jgi:hypothetical protein